MCLVFFCYQHHPLYWLVLAANRDEFYQRPTRSAMFWPDYPEVLAGQDEKAGGTWLGITKRGRIAFLTSYREAGAVDENLPSRGLLVRDFLCGNDRAQPYLGKVATREFAGYNLIVGDKEEIYYYSNRLGTIHRLSPGVYGLSNHLLDTPWPKVKAGRAVFEELLARDIPMDKMSESLFQMLTDRSRPRDEFLPNTGVGLERERLLSSIFIVSSVYGTRSSTVIFCDYKGTVTFIEQNYDQQNQSSSRLKYEFTGGI